MYRAACIALFGICFLLTGMSIASDQDRDRDRDRDQIHEQIEQDRERLREHERYNDDDAIYGSQLMTERERHQYREQLRTMQTPEQREQYRRQHHEKMQQRAKAKGVTLKDFPPEPMHKGSWGTSPGSGRSGQK